MSNQTTLEKMKELRLHGMYRVFNELIGSNGLTEMTADQLVNHLVQTEWEERQNRKLSRYLKDSGLKYRVSIHDIEYNASRNLDKNSVLRYSECNWIHNQENMIITGGTGKSFLASALGFSACTKAYRVKYLNSMKFFAEMKFAHTAGTYSREMAKLKKYDLLIIDDFGLNPFDMSDRLTLLELLEDRYRQSSTMILTQLPVDSWYQVIGDDTIADAVCDRIRGR